MSIVAIALATLVPLPAESRTSGSHSSTSHSTRKKRTRHHSSHRRRRSRSRKRRRSASSKRQFGILVQSSDGRVVVDKHSDVRFNPASAIKLLTAYSALKTLGPEHRFCTRLLLEGELDNDTGEFQGDVQVDGNDPDFRKSDAIALARELGALGVKKVDGKLRVSPGFSLYCNKSALASGKGLKKILRYGDVKNSVVISGPVEVGKTSSTAQEVARHQSERLQDTLKVVLCRSLNSAAERIGSVLGGVKRLREIATHDIGIRAESIQLDTASGLGRNRITPRDMMSVLLALGAELRKDGLDFTSILPVAGVDDGTLERRFTGKDERGSVVAKTGTLTTTDGGVSALVGVMRSQKEDLYFVLFGWHGGVCNFRSFQDQMIRRLQDERGGPRRFDYKT